MHSRGWICSPRGGPRSSKNNTAGAAIRAWPTTLHCISTCISGRVASQGSKTVVFACTLHHAGGRPKAPTTTTHPFPVALPNPFPHAERLMPGPAGQTSCGTGFHLQLCPIPHTCMQSSRKCPLLPCSSQTRSRSSARPGSCHILCRPQPGWPPCGTCSGHQCRSAGPCHSVESRSGQDGIHAVHACPYNPRTHPWLAPYAVALVCCTLGAAAGRWHHAYTRLRAPRADPAAPKAHRQAHMRGSYLCGNNSQPRNWQQDCYLA